MKLLNIKTPVIRNFIPQILLNVQDFYFHKVGYKSYDESSDLRQSISNSTRPWERCFLLRVRLGVFSNDHESENFAGKTWCLNVLRATAPCSFVEFDRSFRGAYCFHQQGDA
jgi:hypothetical protein